MDSSLFRYSDVSQSVQNSCLEPRFHQRHCICIHPSISLYFSVISTVISLLSLSDGSILLLLWIFPLDLVLFQHFSSFHCFFKFYINTKFLITLLSNSSIPITRGPAPSDMAEQTEMMDDALTSSIPLGYNADLDGQVEALKRAKDLFKASSDTSEAIKSSNRPDVSPSTPSASSQMASSEISNSNQSNSPLSSTGLTAFSDDFNQGSASVMLEMHGNDSDQRAKRMWDMFIPAKNESVFWRNDTQLGPEPATSPECRSPHQSLHKLSAPRLRLHLHSSLQPCFTAHFPRFLAPST
jgi:hypothetical protein